MTSDIEHKAWFEGWRDSNWSGRRGSCIAEAAVQFLASNFEFKWNSKEDQEDLQELVRKLFFLITSQHKKLTEYDLENDSWT